MEGPLYPFSYVIVGLMLISSLLLHLPTAFPQVTLEGDSVVLLDNPDEQISAAFTCTVFALPPVPPANISWFLTDDEGNVFPVSGEASSVEGSITVSEVNATLGLSTRMLTCRATNAIGSGEASFGIMANGEFLPPRSPWMGSRERVVSPPPPPIFIINLEGGFSPPWIQPLVGGGAD